MKRSYYVLIFLLFFITTGVYAENKTRFGGQFGYVFQGIFVDVPVSDLSSIRLGVGAMWIAATLEAKYRRRFGASGSRSYWEVGALNVGPINIFGTTLNGGTASLISLGTRFSKREHGGWFANLSYMVGPEGQAIFPNFGYEFAP